MYRLIRDYALIGDCQSAALVSSDASIDWLCLPHFDSPAIFLRLLDEKQGGYCAVEPADLVDSSRRYLPRTNILETEFRTRTGTLAVTDFMPVRQRDAATSHGQDTESEQRLVRLLSCASGTVEFTLCVRPTFSYAEDVTHLVRIDRGVVVAHGRHQALQIACEGQELTPADGRVTARVRLAAGERCALVLTYTHPEQRVWPMEAGGAARVLESTRSYWEKWTDGFGYDGEYRDLLLRSALALKLMTFEETGAIIAAPTTSLPEVIGGERNWDYRFTWLRDATFTLISLMNLGYFGEARDFLHVLQRTAGDTGQLQILYTIHGGSEAQETELSRLAGYRGSQPVRVGNAAVGQKQLDIYGELIHCVYLYAAHPETQTHARQFPEDFWPVVKSAADYVAEHWREPDNGIWEMRGQPRHFVYSKGSCWVALDRALRLGRHFGMQGDFARWRRERDALHDSFFHDGYNAELGAFVQAYGSSDLDASVLRLPLMGVIRADDPRMLSTVVQIERQLMRNGLVYRYRSEDNLRGEEGAFAACGFWLVDNYAMSGREQEAHDLFRHLSSFVNDVGLIAEEIDPRSGEQLGNFPQAFTHIALINSVMRLAHARHGRKPAAHAIAENRATLPRKAA